MFVYRSNSLEQLVDCLSEVVREPLPHPLEREVILIQSPGMERYLSRELARRCGIWAGAEFPFPRIFIRDALDRALKASEAARLYERELLSWVLFDELRRLPADAEFESLVSHLLDDVDSSRRLLLAERFAYLFDQYLTYRPELITSWENAAPPSEMQGMLWRRIKHRLPAEHFAHRCKRFISESTSDALRSALPTRISLFGGPGLPPLYLQILAKMAEVVPVHIFSLTVSRQYFFDLARGKKLDDETDLVHPLLASMGQVGGDFQYLLESLGGYQEGRASFVQQREFDAARPSPTPRYPAGPEKRKSKAEDHQLSLFAELPNSAPNTSLPDPLAAAPPPLSNLKCLQDSLLDGTLSVASAPVERDESITIDVCHSRLREIETLHDRLLAWFAEESTLRPEDVVVFAPDIELYSPLIDAVFSARAGERPRIPHRIVDRSFRHEDPAARALLLGLRLLHGRFKVGDVLDLLQLDPVRSKYEVSSADLERLSGWFDRAQIRCNVDAEHRVLFGLPQSDENTWRFGLRRLLLGYVLADDSAQMHRGIVPFDDVSLSDGPLLGRLCALCDELFSLRDDLIAAGPEGLELSGWSRLLVRLAETLIGESSEGRWDLGALRQSLYELEQRQDFLQRELGAEATDLLLGHAGIVHVVEEHLSGVRFSSDFLSGGVTFCALLPLRNVPFRRVCVLGLNQGEFPRSDKIDPLNLMSEHPHPGDRSLRADDRYLFLELLLSARQRLSLSYVGRSIQDNAPIPPSVLLTELTSTMERLGPDRTLPIREHPLQPFHPSYFSAEPSETGPGRSFEQTYFAGARALSRDKLTPAPFLGAALSPSEPPREVLLSDLIRFFKDPARLFLLHVGVAPEPDGVTLNEREPVELGPLEKYQVGEALLRQFEVHGQVDPAIELRRGTWPVGCSGAVLFEEVAGISREINERGRQLTTGQKGQVRYIEQKLTRRVSDELLDVFEHAPLFSPALDHYQASDETPCVLSGAVTGLYGAIRLTQGFGRKNERRMISLFLEHLALCVQLPDFGASILLSRGEGDEQVASFGFGPIEPGRALALLEDFACLSYLGHHFPLPFFPGPSLLFARKVEQEREREGIGPFYQGLLRAEQRLIDERSASLTQLYRELDPLAATDPTQLEPQDKAFCRLSMYVDRALSGALLEGDPSQLRRLHQRVGQ